MSIAYFHTLCLRKQAIFVPQPCITTNYTKVKNQHTKKKVGSMLYYYYVTSKSEQFSKMPKFICLLFINSLKDQ